MNKEEQTMTDSKDNENKSKVVPEDMNGMAQGNGMERTLKDLTGTRRETPVTPDDDGMPMENVLRDAYSGN